MEGAFNITWSAFTENGQDVTVSTVNGTGITLYFDLKKVMSILKNIAITKENGQHKGRAINDPGGRLGQNREKNFYSLTAPPAEEKIDQQVGQEIKN